MTRFMTVDGLSTSTRTSPERSARVDPVTGGRGWVALAVAVNAVTWYKGMTARRYLGVRVLRYEGMRVQRYEGMGVWGYGGMGVLRYGGTKV